jgi:hypothetical protein
MGTRRQRFLLGALAAAVMLAGCGGGSDSTSSTAGSQPVDQFVQQADEICKQENEKRPKAPTIPVHPSPQQLEATADYFATDLEVTQDTLDRLSGLAPPEGHEEQWTTVLDGVQVIVDNYPALIDAAKSGDRKAFIHALGPIQGGTEDMAPAAADIGLQVCANPG